MARKKTPPPQKPPQRTPRGRRPDRTVREPKAMPITSWWTLYRHHHHDAARCEDQVGHSAPDDLAARLGRGIIHAILALTSVQRGQLQELRKIRRLYETQMSHAAVALNLTGRIVPKQGGLPMAGPFNPTETEDVDLAIAPLNAAGLPVSDTFQWSVSDAAGATLVVSADMKSCKVVTAAGNIDVVVVVSQPRTGITETVAVSRTPGPPDDNNAVSLNISGSVVPKQ